MQPISRRTFIQYAAATTALLVTQKFNLLGQKNETLAKQASMQEATRKKLNEFVNFANSRLKESNAVTVSALTASETAVLQIGSMEKTPTIYNESKNSKTVLPKRGMGYNVSYISVEVEVPDKVVVNVTENPLVQPIDPNDNGKDAKRMHSDMNSRELVIAKNGENYIVSYSRLYESKLLEEHSIAPGDESYPGIQKLYDASVEKVKKMNDGE